MNKGACGMVYTVVQKGIRTMRFNTLYLVGLKESGNVGRSYLILMLAPLKSAWECCVLCRTRIYVPTDVQFMVS